MALDVIDTTGLDIVGYLRISDGYGVTDYVVDI